MPRDSRPPRLSRIPRLMAGACALAVCQAQASPFELDYTGYFSPVEALNPASASSPAFFAAPTPFRIQARFDDSSPNLAPSPPGPSPFAGYRAYAPSAMSVEINGTRYRVSNADNPGMTVSIFDQHSFDPGHYGIGFIVDAPADGSGIIGDFLSAAPDFLVSQLRPTVFTDFVGVGHASGVCLSGFPPNCPHAVTPWVLRDAADTAWNLTLGNYEVDFPAEGLNTARILALPEPSAPSLMLAALGTLLLSRRKRRA